MQDTVPFRFTDGAFELALRDLTATQFGTEVLKQLAANECVMCISNQKTKCTVDVCRKGKHLIGGSLFCSDNVQMTCSPQEPSGEFVTRMMN